ncbi:uncharacterized protein LOC119635134 [Glossina fuscipes]|uniref:Uncharacterized protein LOC119635134 n=1 Tax=Glossina fuscipes TaxID=7396 RepID=A0A8U0WKG5_9MUSC|nr:uncharacterized protein LOC119635134 [Glossina fuscipes]
MLEQQRLGDVFSHRIFFSDETHFSLDVYVNKQDCRICRSKLSTSNWLKTVTFLNNQCMVWHVGVTSPYVLENGQSPGQAATVNFDRYRNVHTKCFRHEIEDVDVEDMGFQKDDCVVILFCGH